MKRANRPRPKQIVIVAPPRVTLQDLTGPYEVLSRAARRIPGKYELIVESFGPGTRVKTKFGLGITCDVPLSRLARSIDTLIVAGSECAVEDPPHPRFLKWLRAAASGARRTASVCLGSF